MDMGRMALLDAGFDRRASGVTLDRFCGSGITTVNLAAASGRGHGGPGHRRRHRDDERIPATLADPSNPSMMDAGNLRCGRATRKATRACAPTPWPRSKGISREALDDLALVSQQRAAAGHRRRTTSRAAWCRCGATTARWRWPRGISAPADHRAKGWPASSLRSRRWPTSARRPGHHLRRPDPPGLSRPEDPPRRTTPATRRAWSTARRGAAGVGRLREEARPEAARPRGGHRQHGR